MTTLAAQTATEHGLAVAPESHTLPLGESAELAFRILGADGRWSLRLRLPEAGVHRMYADFSSRGRSATPAADLLVAGPFEPVALPAPARTAAAEGYRVDLDADGLLAGAHAARPTGSRGTASR